MPPISPSPILLNYIIYTTDTALASAWGAAHPNGVLAGPDRLAASQGLTINYAPAAQPDPSGCWFIAFPNGSPFNPADFVHFDRTVDSGIVDPNDLQYSSINWDPIEYQWWGVILPYYYTAPVPSGTIIPRRWACGFELGGAGNAIGSQPSSGCGPAGSRTTDGYGYTAMIDGAGDITQFTTAPAGTGLRPFCSWERFYLRPQVLPDQGEVVIWQCQGSIEGAVAAFLSMDTGGRLVFRNWGNAGAPGTVLGTSAPLTMNAWVKLDLIINWKNATFGGAVSLFINGQIIFTGAVPSTLGSGLGFGGSLHSSSTIGGKSFTFGALHPTSYKYDVDDWINVSLTNPSLPPLSIDFLNGTHIRLLNPTSTGVGSWTGDYRGLAGNPPGGGVSQMASSTPGARLVLTTDYVNVPQLGLVSVVVQVFPSTWPAGNPVAKVGYQLNGGGLVQTTTTQGGAINGFCGDVFNVGSIPRTDVTAITITLDKDGGSSPMALSGMFGAAEYIGVWGPEDVPYGTTPIQPPVARAGLHNAPYPDCDAVLNPLPSMAWAFARMGTYVGNGTGQDVSVGAPFHWLWVRSLSSNQTEYWTSAQCAVHQGVSGKIGGPIDIGFPLPFPPSGAAATSFYVSGNSGFANQAGVVYQWVAFSDPDSRFLLNGAVAWNAATASAVNALHDPAFTPTCVFTAQEDIASTIGGLFYRGPGHTAAAANPLTGADVANVMTFGPGTLTTQPAAHWRGPQMAYAAWRTTDSTGAFGMVDCVTYIGTGTASRSIAVALNGNSPLFAFGISHSATSYFRDPSHTGSNSGIVNAGQVSTAIIGGDLNTVTVGLLLNATGVVYDLFVLAGTPTPGNWSPNGGPPPDTPPGIPPSPIVHPPHPLPPGPPVPIHGWWQSDAGFRGDVTAIGDARPANPRSWKDFAGFATGSAAMLGGSPGTMVSLRNHLIYAASGYVVGTAAPPIHIFDGTYDRLLTTIPPAGAAVSRAIVSMFVANGVIYLSTWDSGTDKTTWSGRVFSLDIDSASLTPIGDPFPAGHLPYALASLNSQLWCGTHRQDPTVAGKVFVIRPGVETAWTADYDLGATLGLGCAAALIGFNGKLYVGTTAKAGTFGAIAVRNADGTYSVVDLGSGGAATANNGYLAFGVFLNALYAAYWNNDATPVARIRRSVDGLAWTTPYTPSVVRPLIALPVDAGTLYAVGGGLGLSATLASTEDGAAWSDLTPQFPEQDVNTALPAVGVVVF